VAHASSVNARLSGAMLAQMMYCSSQFSLGVSNQVKGVMKPK
jgi:hypothetical protein